MLTITNIIIRQDAEGRYSLVDLYRASGGANRHRPSLWLHNTQTKALIDEIDRENKQEYGLIPEPNLENNNAKSGVIPEPNKAGIPAYSTTQKSGAYAVKELVYAYAMWISPAFSLKVIRAYDALVTGEFIQPNIQHENYWFGRYPHWAMIRTRVLKGEAYRSIAAALGRSRDSIARAVRSMIRYGLLSPGKVAVAQCGPARRAALQQAVGWGQQLTLAM